MMLSIFNCCVSMIGCCGKCCSWRFDDVDFADSGCSAAVIFAERGMERETFA